MDSLLQTLLGQLSGDSLDAITTQLGIDKSTAQKAIGMSLPLLIGSLNRNSSSMDGAQALTNAVALGQASGLKSDQVTQLLAMLAPVVLGALGQAQRQKNLDAQGVASLLTKEREHASSALPGIAQLLDMDGDGDVTEEMINLGGSLLNSFLSKKK
jgi:hypothetical protein